MLTFRQVSSVSDSQVLQAKIPANSCLGLKPRVSKVGIKGSVGLPGSKCCKGKERGTKRLVESLTHKQHIQPTSVLVHDSPKDQAIVVADLTRITLEDNMDSLVDILCKLTD
jgi:hypothetical protein